MKKITLTVVLFLTIISFGFSQTELIYDNNVFTEYQALVPERVFAVRMSPESPCEVIAMKFLVKKEGLSEGAFIHLLYAWNDTEPAKNAVYENLSAIVLDEWKEVNVDGEINFDGDFVVGFKPLDAAAYLAIDEDLQNGRNWVLDLTDTTWTEQTAHTFLIRAVVRYEGATSTEELEGELIEFFPNPAKHAINVVLEDHAEMISLISITGQTVYSEIELEPGIKNIDISAFESGVYLMRVDFQNESIVQKVIIN
jgi:hypothetical protein